MRRGLRSVTVMIGFLAMQLTLLESAAVCLSPHGSAAGAESMTMPGTDAAAADAGESQSDAPAGDSRAPAQSDQHCATMVICALSLGAPTSITLGFVPSPMPPEIAGINVRTPPSSGDAPELPPPRD